MPTSCYTAHRSHITKHVMTLQKQLITYIIVGVINTLFAYSLYALFIFLGMNYPVAMLVSMCFGVLFNFKTFGKFVFDHNNNNVFIKFVAVYVFIYFFNMGFIKFITLYTSNLYLAGFIAIFPAATITFLLNKHLVFRKRYNLV